MLDARFSHLYFCQSLNRLQRGLSAIAELLVKDDDCERPRDIFIDFSYNVEFSFFAPMLLLRKITQTSLFHATTHVILIGDWYCQRQCQRKFSFSAYVKPAMR